MRRFGKTAVVAGVAAAIVGAAAAPAAAATPFTATYGQATASGTVVASTPSPMMRKVVVTGQVTATNTACYRVQKVVQQDLVSQVVPLADHCGTGVTPFSTEQVLMALPTRSVSIQVCGLSGGLVTRCGSPVRV